MKLRVTHRTEYIYSQPVRSNSNELRFTPLHNDRQERRFFLLRVLPSARLRRFTDLNFNWVNFFEIEEPHQRLLIEAQSAVTTQNQYQNGEPLGVKLGELNHVKHADECYPFLQESCYVKITPEIWRAAVDARGDSEDVFVVTRTIMDYLHKLCRYVPGASSVTTNSAEFFLDARGVCQDFTHLMLAMCRSLGIPARYVSGYLYDPTRREMRGAHASHAWCEVFIPGRGWYGFDPTNSRLADDYYVMLAVGRDYDDVAPVKGTFLGSGSRTMNVLVHIQDE